MTYLVTSRKHAAGEERCASEAPPLQHVRASITVTMAQYSEFTPTNSTYRLDRADWNALDKTCRRQLSDLSFMTSAAGATVGLKVAATSKARSSPTPKTFRDVFPIAKKLNLRPQGPTRPLHTVDLPHTS